MKKIIILFIIIISNAVRADENNNIFEIVKNNDSKVIDYIEKIKDVNVKDQFDCDIFTYALANRNFDLAKKVLEKGYNINNRDKYGNTLLHNIICSNDYEIIKFLVQNKIDINLKNFSGNTPLHFASQKHFNNPEILLNRFFISKIIIYNKIKSIINTDETQNTSNFIPIKINSVHNAILTGNSEAVELLIKKIKNINQQDIYGMTYLDWAVLFNKSKVRDLLIKNGATYRKIDLDIKKIFYEENIEIYKYLLENNADVNVINNYKIAPVHIVVSSMDIEKLKLLIKYKAVLNNDDKRWRYSPLHFLSYSFVNVDIKNELIKILLENGASPEESQYYFVEKNNQNIKRFKIPDEYNLKIVINEIMGDDPEKDVRSFYKIFIDKEEKGRTNVALESQYKEYKVKLEKNKHLLKIVKYRLDREKGKYKKLNNIEQPKPDFIYFEIPENRVILIKINNDKKNNKCNYEVSSEMEKE